MSVRQTALVLVCLQLLILGLYLSLGGEPKREPVFQWERLAGPTPALRMERDGAPATLAEGPQLVHFWATWCLPCREELPALLEAAEGEGVPLVAVTDEPWELVERYFGGDVPFAIVRDPTGQSLRDWEVSGLPDTFAVRDGQVVGRMGGVRAWGTQGARAFLRELGGE